MANLVGTATIKIIPDTAGFSAALNGQLKSVGATANKAIGGTLGPLESARGSLSAFGDSLNRTSERAILAGGAMTYGLTRPLIGLASTMVGTAAEFEKSMNTIAAVADIDLGSAELGRIGDRARELAQTFPQDANQIAKGMLDLARAGLDTADQLDAVIVPVMQLATIEDVDLATASELLVNVFTGFGGSFTEMGEDVKTIFGEVRGNAGDLTDEFTYMSDILAHVSAATTTDLVDLANAFRYAGPVAATAGIEFEEAAAALGILAQAGFNACYDAETEVLTKNGFKPWSLVTADDLFATVNPETHALEYQEAINLYEYDYSGDMYQVRTSKVDLLVTPNHRMWVRPGKSSNGTEYGLKMAASVKGKDVRYLKRVEWEGYTPEAYVLPGFDQDRASWVKRVDDKIVDSRDWATFMGYYLSEGSCRYRSGSGYSVVLTQNEGSVKGAMCAVLDRMGFNYNVSGKNIEVSNQQLYNEVYELGTTTDKRVPRYLLEWDRDHLREFYEAFRQGDGDEQNNLYTSSKFLVEQLQEVVLKCGWSPRAVKRYEAGDVCGSIDGREIVATTPGYTILVNQSHLEPRVYHANYNSARHNARVNHHVDFKDEFTYYVGKVYCAEVPNHLLVVRRNGHVVVCGNTVGGTALRGIITRLAIPTRISQEIFDKFGLSVEGAFAPEAIEQTGEAAEETSKILRAAGLDAREISEVLGTQGVDGIDAFNSQLSSMGLTTLDVFDEATGQMKPLQEVVDRFVDSGARVGDVMKLFGQRSGPAFLALMAQAGAFKELTGEVRDADGAMSAMSDKIQQSAAVKFQLLRNAIVDLAISVGESGVLDFFTEMALSITDFVQKLSDTNPQIVKWVFVFGGMVAALGPATLLFGLFGKALAETAKTLAFMLGPVGAVVAAVAVAAAAFGFMYTQSESLRAAVSVLGTSLQNVLGPILEVGRTLLGAFSGGVGALAENLGNSLAPKIIEVAEAINNWVSSGGLAEFLTGVGEKIVEVGSFIYDLVRNIQELGIMEAMGDAWQRIWTMLVGFVEHFDTVLDNLVPTLKVFAEIIGTGIAVGIRIAWQAGAALLSILEKVLDVVGPLIRFLGDHLVGAMSLLVVGFLLFGRSLVGATLGLTRLGAAAGTSLTKVAVGLENAGLKAGLAGQAIGTFAANLSARLDRSTPAVAMVGAQFDRLGQAAQRVGAAVFTGLAVAGSAIRSLGVIATNVLQNASLLMAGFFGGQMAARADDLSGAITALIPTFIAMGIAITAGLGPAGTLLMVGTALAAVLGMITGRAKEATDAIGLDIRENIDSLAASMANLNGEMSLEAVLTEFANSINELNPRNFATIQRHLEETGFTVGDLTTALDGGAQSASDFSDKMASAFADKNLTGELESFSFVLRGSGDALDKFNSSTQNVSGEFAKNLVESGKYVEILDKNTGEVIARVDNLNDLTGVMTGKFQEAFGGQLIKDFGVSLDEARLKYEAMQPLLELQQRNQDYINDKAKTWSDRIGDANSALDETKRRMRDLFAPVDDAGQNIADLYEAIRSNKDAFINPQTGQPWLEIPSPDTEAGAKWLRSVQDVKNLWVDTQSIIANGINPALDDAVKIETFQNRLYGERLRLIGNLSSAYQISPEQATVLADQIAGVLPNEQEIRLILGIDEGGINSVEAQYKAMQERFKLDKLQVKIFAEFQLDPTSAEADKFAKIIAGIDDISPAKIDLIVNALDQMDPTLRDWVKTLISEGKVGPNNIVSFIDLIPRITEAGIGGIPGATLAALLQGQDPNAIEQYIDLIPRLGEATGFGPEGTASILQMLIGKSPEDIQKFFDIIPNIKDIPDLTEAENLGLSRIIAGAPVADAQKIIGIFSQLRAIDGLDEAQQLELARILGGKSPADADKIIQLVQGNPDMFAEILPLLAGETIATTQLIVDVIARGDVGLLNAAELVAAAQFAVNGGFGAQGGIFTKATNMIIGEDGPEVLIPLSKPNRARSLIEQSGLYGKFPPSLSKNTATTTLGGTPPVLPAGTFQSVTPAAEGYATAIWATGVASGFSTEAQTALAAQMGFPMDTTPIDEATAKVDGLTAALERARNLMEIMAASDASGVVSEDDPRWDWMTMGNQLGPGGITADQYRALDPAIRTLLDQADNYAEAVDVLDDYGFTGFSPGVSPTLSGVSDGMSLLQGVPLGDVSTPNRAAGNSFNVAVTVQATPETTKEHAAMVGATAGDAINRKLALKSAVFSS